MNARSHRFRTTSRAEFAEVALHFLEWGERSHPTVVLLHGGGANAHWWDHLAPSLAERFHLVALDFRGHGDSERPQELVPGAFTEDLRALLARLDASNAVLIGHSMGAHVALEHVASTHDSRALVLLDPSRGSGAKHRRRMRLALTFRRTYASREEAVARYRFLPAAPAASETLRHAIADASVEQEQDGRWGYKFDPRWFGLPSRGPFDTTGIRCPTLIVRGADSRVLSEEGAQQLCGEIPGAQLEVVEGAAHHVQLDDPQAVIRLLSSFLDRVATTTKTT